MKLRSYKNVDEKYIEIKVPFDNDIFQKIVRNGLVYVAKYRPSCLNESLRLPFQTHSVDLVFEVTKNKVYASIYAYISDDEELIRYEKYCVDGCVEFIVDFEDSEVASLLCKILSDLPTIQKI